MQKETKEKLIAANAKFYSEVAGDFSNSRQTPWRGWEKLWKDLQNYNLQPSTILDVGCGNARFLDFLQTKIDNFYYIGIDNNSKFIEESHNKHPSHKFIQADLGMDLPEEILLHKYDLIILIAVLHHLPGYNSRIKLLNTLSKVLTNRGMMAITYWNFLEEPSLKRKIYPFTELGINSSLVEEGDYLLNWGDGNKHLRYCHYFSKDEKQKVINDIDLEFVSGFDADGKSRMLNTYQLFMKTTD